MIHIDFSFLFLLRLKFFLNGSYLLLYLLDRRKMHLYLLDLKYYSMLQRPSEWLFPEKQAVPPFGPKKLV